MDPQVTPDTSRRFIENGNTPHITTSKPRRPLVYLVQSRDLPRHLGPLEGHVVVIIIHVVAKGLLEHLLDVSAL
jgi:hypothetical protein